LARYSTALRIFALTGGRAAAPEHRPRTDCVGAGRRGGCARSNRHYHCCLLNCVLPQ
jgi:hypothetical protein